MVGRPHTFGARVYERLCSSNTESEHYSNNIKGKFHPRTVDEFRETEKSYSCIISLTSALNIRECLTSLPGLFCTSK